MKLPSMKEFERAVDWPAESWAGNCYGVAKAIEDDGLLGPDWKAVYGHFLGEVHRDSTFFGSSRTGFVQHGWLENRETGEVIDPTRWVFECKEPYVYYQDYLDEILTPCVTCGHLSDEHYAGFLNECEVDGCDCPAYEAKASEYDRGGNAWRAAMMTEAPEYSGKDPKKLAVSVGAGAVVDGLLGDNWRPDGLLCIKQRFWLANVPIQMLGPFAGEVYEAFEKNGEVGLIPIDNWEMAQ